ncbi:DUF6931 family protein [Vannielia litorea]|uniref:Uncharacterized protein n=1 Tax=Vannielia litorea TaxID=1217970 RepID=A0A1N6G0W2_9RHOB|nr:hypothetical protein [Vannielia litorea]SIO01117.1 hypothetical protein SAMN05444002_2113 [Vannielia litorea]
MGDSQKTVIAGATDTAKRKNLRFEVAQELYDAIPEIEEDVTARPNGHTSVDFIGALAEGETPEEALTYCAYVLPRRFAVWWGHECLKKIEDTLDQTDRDMLELAAKWVGDPIEDSRYKALDAAMEAKIKSPGVWVALGAGWSSGSMAGPDVPPVPPPPFLTARAVNAGLLSALARFDIKTRGEHLQRFIRMAVMLTEEG